MCRSVDYNYNSKECRLCEADRRTPVDSNMYMELMDATGDGGFMEIVNVITDVYI